VLRSSNLKLGVVCTRQNVHGQDGLEGMLRRKLADLLRRGERAGRESAKMNKQVAFDLGLRISP